MYFYQIYGLKVSSNFEIPEAMSIPTAEVVDVVIEEGTVPHEELVAAKAGKLCRLDTEIAWFYLEQMGMFYVEKGRHIIVWKESDVLTDLSRNSYVTGTTFGLLLFQRGLVPIHSGAMVKNKKAVIVVGDSGAGKSTLCNHLQEEGFSFLSDDVSVVEKHGEHFVVQPAFPQQKLCKDAVLRKGYPLEDLIYIDEYRDKYAIRLRDGFEKEACPIAFLLELIVTDEKDLRIEEVTGLQKIGMLRHNIYRKEAWKEMGMSKEAQSTMMEIVNTVPMFRVFRPREGIHLQAITSWIQNRM